jgi:hypothetical protein
MNIKRPNTEDGQFQVTRLIIDVLMHYHTTGMLTDAEFFDIMALDDGSIGQMWKKANEYIEKKLTKSGSAEDTLRESMRDALTKAVYDSIMNELNKDDNDE